MKIVDHSNAAYFIAIDVSSPKRRKKPRFLVAATPAAMERQLKDIKTRSMYSILALDDEGYGHPVVLERVGRAVKATTWRLL
jgi:hypothetical protein